MFFVGEREYKLFGQARLATLNTTSDQNPQTRYLYLENNEDRKMRDWDDKTDRGTIKRGCSANRLEIVSLSGSSPDSEHVMGRSPGSGQIATPSRFRSG